MARLAAIGNAGSAALALLVSGCSNEPGAPHPTPHVLEVMPLDAPTNVEGRWPSIVAQGGGLALCWTESGDGDHSSLLVARRTDTGFSEPVVAAQGGPWFVNWADFPAIAPLGANGLVATWLGKLGAGTYAYGVYFAVSEDGGATFGAPRLLHSDQSESEHGFVSLEPLRGGRVAAFWLDGRNTATQPPGAMALYGATIELNGSVANEIELDPRVCDCCQTASALLHGGELMVAYRDRSPDEVRDIALVRGAPSSAAWSAPHTAHGDGWRIPGCPVNGPALASHTDGAGTWLAWFTEGSGDAAPARVLLAFSSNDGANFDAPIEVDRDAKGHVDVVALADGTAIVTWLATVDDFSNRWMARSAARDGKLGEPVEIAAAPEQRRAGFLRLAQDHTGAVATWTADGGGVRLARIVAVAAN